MPYPSHLLSLMVVSGYSSDGSDHPKPSDGPGNSKSASSVVAVLCGALGKDSNTRLPIS